ncbi:DUF1289 domain-containing protein [SAR86 cluster bacterium]|jgi:predicted Fe-S protein YdhL (DUF1289 family)|nr:DUF1289 domain-containing protein [SAR86 cluster bacterium]|tara:strand:+ start:622 stop:1086 length:465 start_codon:yes stop_codon:yes gene_type:complete
MSKDSSARTRTPCVGICSTTYGDDVCRGCKRFIHEVINWNSFNPEEKESVWKRLEKLKTLIMQSKISIINETLMEEKIEELQLKINSDLNSLSKAFEIVKLTSKSFDDLNEFGIKIVNKDVSLIDLKEEIEKELYDLSMAHFNRYFVEPIRKIK